MPTSHYYLRRLVESAPTIATVMFNTDSSANASFADQIDFNNATVVWKVNNGHDNNGNHDTSENNGNFNSTVFWSVNAFILFMVVAGCCSCYWGAKYLLHSDQHRADSDRAFVHAVHRRDRRMQSNNNKALETPMQRQQRLKDSFTQHQVRMSVQDTDVITDLEESEAVALKSQILSSTDGSNDGDKDAQLGLEDPTIPVDTAIQAATTITENDGSDNDDCEGGESHTPTPITYEQQHLDEMEACEAGYVVLRRASTSTSTEGSSADSVAATLHRRVPNCCAICLGPYEAGESLVWSSNPACKHAFHEECVTDWLTKMQNGTPCPCCRQEFCKDLGAPEPKQRRITWEAGTTFNTRQLRLR